RLLLARRQARGLQPPPRSGSTRHEEQRRVAVPDGLPPGHGGPGHRRRGIGPEVSSPVRIRGRRPADEGADPAETYYDRPVLREPVWLWAVPAYFYAGGAAGAAAVLAACAQAVDRQGMAALVSRGRWVAAAGSGAGTALLVHDLGRPARFL